jgi:ribose 5-phosphate isomerase B
MKLFLAADHRGFELKRELLTGLANKAGLEVDDLGAHQLNLQDDYPEYVEKVATAMLTQPDAKAILLCGSGIGMSIAANKSPNLVAALINTKEELQREAGEHGANVLVFSADIWRDKLTDLLAGLDNWLLSDTKPEGRHLRRMNQIEFWERVQLLGLRKPIIAPAILTDEIVEAEQQTAQAANYAAIVNFDFMDGTTTEAKTIELEQISNLISTYPDKFFSVHLMTEKPLALLQKLSVHRNVLLVYIHVEAGPTEVQGCLTGEWPFQLGLTFDAESPANAELAREFPVVQIMTINSGAQGEPFEPQHLEKVSELRAAGYEGEIHLDGGLNVETIPQTLQLNPDLIAVGSALSRSSDRSRTYQELLQLLGK